MTHFENKSTKHGFGILRFASKLILWLISVPLILLLLLFIVLQFPQTQQYLTQKAGTYLSKKLNTAVKLEKFTVSFPKTIALQEFYIEDQLKDTLLYSRSLNIDIALWDLFSKKITIHSVAVDGFTGHIQRRDSAFNFDFIINAFASSKKDTFPKPEEKAEPWQFTINKIELRSVYFTYHDEQSGTHIDAHIGVFETDLDAFDMAKSKIKLGKARLAKSSVLFVQNTPLVKDTTVSAPLDYDLGFSEIRMDTLAFFYKDHANGQNLDVSIGRFFVSGEQLDLKNKRIGLDQLTLERSHIYLGSEKQVLPEESPKRQMESHSTGSWLVTLKHLIMKDNLFAYNNKAIEPLKTGVDYNHLLVQHVSVTAKDIYASPERIKLRLSDFSLSEKSGLAIKKLSAEILYDSSQASLTALDLQTNNSHIKGDFQVRYSSLQSLKDSVAAIFVTTRFDPTSVDMAEVSVLVPGLFNQAILANTRNSKVRIKGRITGKLDDLVISELELRLLQSTLVKLNGSVKHATDPENMYLQLKALQVSSSQKDIKTVVPDSLLPKGITIPERFDLNGSFTGYFKNFNSALQLHSSIGSLSINTKMNPAAGNVERPYELIFKTDSFNLARLVNQPNAPGPVSLTARIKGSGFDPATAHAEINTVIKSAIFKGYEYKDLSFSGTIDHKVLVAHASIDDENIAFTFDGTLSADTSKPEYVFTLDLKGADLKALHLSEEDLRISAFVESDIRDRSRKNVEGRAAIRNLLILHNSKKYRLDSLVFTSEFKDSVARIALKSDIMDAEFKGDLTLAQLPALMRQHVNSYFAMGMSPASEKLNPQTFTFDVTWKDAALLSKNIVPALEKLSPFSINGNYSSEEKKINLNVSVPQVIYSGVRIDSLKLKVNSGTEKMNISLNANQISNPTLKFENIYLGTELKNNTLRFQFNTNKDDSSKTLDIAGVLKSLPAGFELRLNPDVVFNGENWNVDANNFFMFGKRGMYARQFVLSNGNRALAVNSAEPRENAPLEVTFTDFDLAVISKLIENNNDLIKGFINGNIVFEQHNNARAFRSDLVIRDFAFKGVPVGTIKLQADNYGSSSVYAVNMGIEGGGNDILANGSYHSASKTNNLDFTLDIRNLNLASIEPFTFGQVVNMSGSANGKLGIKGSTGKPELNGRINFKEAGLKPKVIDSHLTIHDGTVVFSNRQAQFNSFAIYDSLNNKAMVNGFVNIENLIDPDFDLNVKTTNFLALNTDRKDNPVYYGRVFLDSDLGIKGTMAAPRLTVKAKLNKGSYVTYVKPENLVSKNESKGIVEFTDSLYKDGIMTRGNDSLNGPSEIKGIDLNAIISFDKSVQLKMFVDQESGDSLYVVGGGTLDFSLDRSGKTSLTGKYRINDGGYHLSISDLVKRNFKIESGSSVTWSGDVLDAYVDLKAIYTIKTSPIDLVQNEVSAMSEQERNKYRNLLTFMVYLKMTGFISAPEISFDIQLAPGDRGALNGTINSKLGQLREDETELNKQVFALLTLRRFIGENPLDNGNDGGGLTSASRSSASKVLTQQLNNLSNKYVNFVDLDLGVNSFEDYSTGQEEGRTQLQVGVSKQLLNDKVSVHVGGNVELEGERAKQNNASDVAGNISIDYKLTKDGRYKLKAFRENQYENPIEGELTKTGMGIIYVRNYNTLRELLSKPVKKDAR